VKPKIPTLRISQFQPIAGGRLRHQIADRPAAVATAVAAVANSDHHRSTMEIPSPVQELISELNAGDVGFETFPDGSVLRFEGFTDQCWQAYEERFGPSSSDNEIAIIESEMLCDWLARHPETLHHSSDWEGGNQPWDDCLFWAYLVPKSSAPPQR
jgi:hypothetical protein